jgi:hypothetical protein
MFSTLLTSIYLILVVIITFNKCCLKVLSLQMLKTKLLKIYYYAIINTLVVYFNQILIYIRNVF